VTEPAHPASRRPPSGAVPDAWARLHAWLLPDYTRGATIYWWTMVVLGAASLAYALWQVARGDRLMWLHVGAAVALATAAGLFPVRIARSKNSFAAGEIFVFLLLLMHGAAAAALAAAADSATGSWRTTRRWSSRIASPALTALAMLLAGSALEAFLEHVTEPGQSVNAGWVVAAMLLMALAYFLISTMLVGLLPRLKRNEWLRLADIVGVFGWVGTAYAASAAVAALVFLAYKVYGVGVVLGLVPVLGMLLAALHYLFGQQEAAAAADALRAEAEAREAELAARHMRELEASERRFQHLAFHDSLTGLPNRRRFHELLSVAVDEARAERSGVRAADFAVMFLDFDRFKLINDSLGHDAGDAFLVQVARRIAESLRPEDVVARLGGDEFAVLVRLEREAQAVALAERLMEALKRPFKVAGTELITSASIGITFSKFGYTAPEHVLRDADTAMYKAKGAGKARYALFDGSLHTEVARRLRLEGELRQAIEAEQLSVAYQPIHELSSGRLAGFEALVRWKHPADGAIAPGTFLPIAEEAGLMVRISDFVLHCACLQLRRWQDRLARAAEEGGAGRVAPRLTMSVNVSAHDLAHPGFVARVSRALVESGVPAQQLTLELTEHILMSHLEGALDALSELRRLGVGLAVDDFGTGYSSLSHLATLPIDTLKIDRSFVTRLKSGSKEAAVVRSVILLGSSLGKSVLAEGIETESQLGQLDKLGCQLGQGFLLAPPLTAEEAGALLGGASWRETPSPAAPGQARATTMAL
jgi:diguanylate cyclase (GGDEF)-like protein